MYQTPIINKSQQVTRYLLQIPPSTLRIQHQPIVRFTSLTQSRNTRQSIIKSNLEAWGLTSAMKNGRKPRGSKNRSRNMRNSRD